MMDVSCAFPPGPETPDHIALAEELGFRRAWVYDSPALYSDVWVTLARAADRTGRIGLGPGVLVPSLRHVMTTAAAIAGLEAIAPGRTVVGIGSGFTGRMTLGKRPNRWADVAAYVEALRALLRGEEVEWDGAVIKMIHPPGFAADRPVDVPILVGGEGPKGMQVARDLADGLFSVTGPKEGFTWCAVLQFGTVLEEGEVFDSPRVLDCAGPAVGGFYHGLYEWAGPDGVGGLPGGDEWRMSIEAIPERTRHLAVHEGHMVYLTDRDRQHVTGEMVAAMTFTGTAKDLAERMLAMEQGGATELVVQPGGTDIERELRKFAAMAGLAGLTS
jgi:5,10-methylenetetrahydromethanopterin reductase